jgi:hypothetical protein
MSLDTELLQLRVDVILKSLGERCLSDSSLRETAGLKLHRGESMEDVFQCLSPLVFPQTPQLGPPIPTGGGGGPQHGPWPPATAGTPRSPTGSEKSPQRETWPRTTAGAPPRSTEGGDGPQDKGVSKKEAPRAPHRTERDIRRLSFFARLIDWVRRFFHWR